MLYGCTMRWDKCYQGNTLTWDGHSIDSSTVQYRSMTRSSVPRADSDLKSTYCFCAHMHEMMKYFLFTEIHEQCLNQLSVPSWESSICRRIDRVTIPSESIPLATCNTQQKPSFRFEKRRSAFAKRSQQSFLERRLDLSPSAPEGAVPS